jgi:hypothetical protein
MIELTYGLDAEVERLSGALGNLTSRGMAAIFGVCGRAPAPLVEQVEQRSEGGFAVPEFALALNSSQIKPGEVLAICSTVVCAAAEKGSANAGSQKCHRTMSKEDFGKFEATGLVQLLQRR